MNHDFGLREGRQTLFAPPPPGALGGPPLLPPRRSRCRWRNDSGSAASGAEGEAGEDDSEGEGGEAGGEGRRLVERPARLPFEVTLLKSPGQMGINVGLYSVEVAAEDLAMVWLVADWSSQYFR